MSDRFGLLQLPAATPAGDPATSAIGDPLLDRLLAFLQAGLNADTKAIWAKVHPAFIAPATEPLPVRRTFAHDPDEGAFSSNTLPALFAWRQGFPRHIELTQEWTESTTTVAVLWVPPPASLEHARIRQPFRNVVDKALTRLLRRERHPAWVLAGDTDPNAADLGSLLIRALNVAKIDLVDVKPFDLLVERGTKQEPYDAVIATIEVKELLVPVLDDFATLDRIEGSITTNGGTFDAFSFKPSIESVTPSSGPLAGGTPISVVGRQFFEDDAVGDLIVTVGGVRCTSVALVDGDTITATTPPGSSAGAKDVVVTIPSGATSAPLVGGFTYV